MKRGDIYIADLSPSVGYEQDGIRPVVILQNDVGNRYSHTVIVATITTKNSANLLPTQVLLEKGVCKLNNTSVIQLEQIRTIDKSRLRESLGKLDSTVSKKVNAAIAISLDLKVRPQQYKAWSYFPANLEEGEREGFVMLTALIGKALDAKIVKTVDSTFSHRLIMSAASHKKFTTFIIAPHPEKDYAATSKEHDFEKLIAELNKMGVYCISLDEGRLAF